MTINARAVLIALCCLCLSACDSISQMTREYIVGEQVGEDCIESLRKYLQQDDDKAGVVPTNKTGSYWIQTQSGTVAMKIDQSSNSMILSATWMTDEQTAYGNMQLLINVEHHLINRCRVGGSIEILSQQCVNASCPKIETHTPLPEKL